jgi:hypothetical protein
VEMSMTCSRIWIPFRPRVSSGITRVPTMHEFASLPAYACGAGAGTCRVCLPMSGCFSSHQTLMTFMENPKLLGSLFLSGKSP